MRWAREDVFPAMRDQPVSGAATRVLILLFYSSLQINSSLGPCGGHYCRRGGEGVFRAWERRRGGEGGGARDGEEGAVN